MILKLALLALVAAASAMTGIPRAEAGTENGRIDYIKVRDDGLIYFELDGVQSNRPACSEGYTYWMIKDEDSTFGKSQLQLLMAAWLSGRAVTVKGANECTRWPDGEDVRLITVGGD